MSGNMPMDGSQEQFAADPVADPAASGLPAEQGEQTELQDGSAPQSQAPAFDPKQYEINYKGQKIYPKDRAHLQTLLQKGYSASQAMEMLNKEKEAVGQMKEKYGKYEALDKAFTEHPEFGEKIWNLQREYQQGIAGGESEQDPHMLEIKQELNEVKGFMQQFKQEKAQREISEEINGLKDTYKQFAWGVDEGDGLTLEKRVMKHAVDNNMTSLKAAFRDMMFDEIQNNAKAEGLRAGKENRQAQAQNGVVVDGKKGAPPAPAKKGYNPNMSYNDLAEMAKTEFNGG